jgi:hypothetical protein
MTRVSLLTACRNMLTAWRMLIDCADSGLTITDDSGLTPVLVRLNSLIFKLVGRSRCGFTHRTRYRFIRLSAAVRARRFPQSVDQEIATRALQAIDEDPLDPDQAHLLELFGTAVDPCTGPVEVAGHGFLGELDFSIHARLRRHGCVDHLRTYRQLPIMDDLCGYYAPACRRVRVISAWFSHGELHRMN